MAAEKAPSRPQTLRQARRAYQKSGAATRLTERQMRQIERNAELQDRADRIKEREARRKANLKKKNEKLEREKEARARMGIPEPIHEDVGPSQMRLGAFIVVGPPRDTTGTCVQPPLTWNAKPAQQSTPKTGSPAVERRETPMRYPLEPRSSNGVVKPPSHLSPKPRSKTHVSPSNHQLATSQACHVAQAVRQSTPSDRKDKSHQEVKPPARPRGQPTPPERKRKESPQLKPPERPLLQPLATKVPSRPPAKVPQAPMPPPPRPTPKFKPTAPSQQHPKTPFSAPPKPLPAIDEWAAFLVSNTQIEREICSPKPAASLHPPPPTKANLVFKAPPLPLSRSRLPSSPCPAPAAKAPRPRTLVPKANIRAQDLPRTKPKEDRDQEFTDDITDCDLEGAVLHAEKSATPRPPAETQTGSFCDDLAGLIPTQEFRELVDCM